MLARHVKRFPAGCDHADRGRRPDYLADELGGRFEQVLIGVLLAIDGLAYLVYGFTYMLAPGVAAHLNPWISLPAPLGEGSLCLWLLVAGVNVRRWKERASMAIRATSALVEELA